VQEAMKSTRLGFTAGTIDVENMAAFERLLFRATRGNMFLRHADVGNVVDPNTNKLKEKAVFVVFYAGERAKLKITKV
jgi:V-type H+-transporting ATPase subunit a